MSTCRGKTSARYLRGRLKSDIKHGLDAPRVRRRVVFPTAWLGDREVYEAFLERVSIDQFMLCWFYVEVFKRSNLCCIS